MQWLRHYALSILCRGRYGRTDARAESILYPLGSALRRAERDADELGKFNEVTNKDGNDPDGGNLRMAGPAAGYGWFYRQP